MYKKYKVRQKRIRYGKKITSKDKNNIDRYIDIQVSGKARQRDNKIDRQ